MQPDTTAGSANPSPLPQPLKEGIAAGATILAVSAVCLVTLHTLGLNALRTEVRGGLVRVAKTAAAFVDGTQHARFTAPEQEREPAYAMAVAPLQKILRSREDIRFLYTMALRTNRVHIILDATPHGDTDKDGVEDHSPLMQPYDAAAPALLNALRTGRAQTDTEPVRDEWGSYLSGYAPIFDNEGQQTGIAGVDVRTDAYLARLATMRHALWSGLLLALTASTLLGAVVWHTRRGVRQALAKQGVTAHALHDSEERFRQMFDRMLDGFALHELICDEQGRPVDYRFLAVNPAFERLTGLKAEHVVGHTVREVMPHTEAHWITTYGHVAQTGEPITFENYSHDLARYYEVSAYSPAPGQFACLFVDTTARRQIQMALEEREERYRLLVGALSDALFVHDIQPDGRSGPFIEVNDEACRRLGYTREELLKRAGTDIVAPDTQMDIASITAQLKTGQPVTFEQVHVSSEGHFIPVEIHARALNLGGKQVVLSLARDITERKQMERERERVSLQLLHTQKLEGLGLIAGGIAHDFNNLLMAVLGNADLALADIDAHSPVHASLLEIKTTALRAADLCRQMLAYSGRGRFVLEPLDLSLLVGEMSHLLQVSISKQAMLRFNLARVLPAIEADATQMRQVVLNLVINGSEAIGSRSGAIGVTTGVMECDEAYIRTTYLNVNTPPGTYAYVEVSDTGCGMDSETQARIFDPFFTTKFTGRGLGLAAVLGIVRGHRGAIKVYSEVGKGTTFKVLFPTSQEAARAPAAAEAPTANWRGEGTVLLVDDEETVRWIGKRMLERLGFRVITACDGSEAIQVFQQQSPPPTCVVMDLTMPHMDGESAFRELRRIKPDLKVIICSGYNEQEVTERFVGKGLTGFVAKPYQFGELRDVLRGALEHGE